MAPAAGQLPFADDVRQTGVEVAQHARRGAQVVQAETRQADHASLGAETDVLV